jgi:hypothetical protein
LPLIMGKASEKIHLNGFEIKQFFEIFVRAHWKGS